MSSDDIRPNGVPLCPNLHRTFDRHLFRIDAAYCGRLAEDFGEPGGDYGVRRFERQTLRLPQRTEWWRGGTSEIRLVKSSCEVARFTFIYGMRFLRLFLPVRRTLVALLALTSCQPQTDKTTASAATSGLGQWAGVAGHRLWAQAYPSARLGPHPTLLLVLHGDAPFNKPAYQYIFARQAAQANANVVAVALLRPGYSDPAGHQSDGTRGQTTGDNYTPAVIDAIAAALDTLKARYHAERVVVAGHSGGAAITAALLGRYPGRADAALLVSCPCNVATWRAHMKRHTGGGAIWDQPVASVSPEQVVARIPATTRVALLVGTADSIAPKGLTEAYYRRLQAQGIPATLHELPGLDHEIFLSKAVQQELKGLLH